MKKDKIRNMAPDSAAGGQRKEKSALPKSDRQINKRMSGSASSKPYVKGSRAPGC